MIARAAEEEREDALKPPVAASGCCEGRRWGGGGERVEGRRDVSVWVGGTDRVSPDVPFGSLPAEYATLDTDKPDNPLPRSAVNSVAPSPTH